MLWNRDRGKSPWTIVGFQERPCPQVKVVLTLEPVVSPVFSHAGSRSFKVFLVVWPMRRWRAWSRPQSTPLILFDFVPPLRITLTFFEINTQSGFLFKHSLLNLDSIWNRAGGQVRLADQQCRHSAVICPRQGATHAKTRWLKRHH